VRFTINRSEAGGTVLTLTRLAKKAGYQGIIINVDESLENQHEEHEGGAQAPNGPAPADAVQQGPEPRALPAELAALARRIPEAAGADAGLKERLLKLATGANANLKANNLNDAARLLGELRHALEAAGVAPKQEGAPAPANPFATELGALVRRIRDSAASDPHIAAELTKLAAEANASIKAGDNARAADLIGQLRSQLGAGELAPEARTQAAAAFEAARPSQAPGAPMTGSLLAAMARAAPEAAEELPSVLAGMIPRFLLAIQNEPNMQAQPMQPGATLPTQDQLLMVADSLNAVLRSARLWESLLNQAETADGTIDELEQADRDEAAQKDYEDLVTSYNGTRSAALAEEANCMQLVAALAAEFRAAQATAR